MPREPVSAKKKRANDVLSRLDREMPGARIELDFESPFQLLVAVVLSAQCTDRRVNLVTPRLFERCPTPQALAARSTAEVEDLIRTVGLYRSKAAHLVALARRLCEHHGGDVPRRRAELEALPGVGKKTAGVVTLQLGTELAFPVDTHVRRLAGRLAFSTETDPDRVEEDLRALVPSDWWKKGHQLLVWHGRRTCRARRPACKQCCIAALCPSRPRGLRPPGPARP